MLQKITHFLCAMRFEVCLRRGKVFYVIFLEDHINVSTGSVTRGRVSGIVFSRFLWLWQPSKCRNSASYLLRVQNSNFVQTEVEQCSWCSIEELSGIRNLCFFSEVIVLRAGIRETSIFWIQKVYFNMEIEFVSTKPITCVLRVSFNKLEIVVFHKWPMVSLSLSFGLEYKFWLLKIRIV